MSQKLALEYKEQEDSLLSPFPPWVALRWYCQLIRRDEGYCCVKKRKDAGEQ